MSRATTRNAKLGGSLVLVAVASWALLPVVSKGLLGTIDHYTLNLFRFAFAIVMIPFYIHVRQKKTSCLALVQSTALY